MSRSASKGLQNFANPIFALSHTTARADCNGLHFRSRAIEIIVDDCIIVTTVRQHLLPRALKAAAHFIVRILPALENPLLDILAGRRQDENGDRLRQLLLSLQGALHVDLKYEISLL